MTSMEITCLMAFNRSFSIGKQKISKAMSKTISFPTEIGSAFKMMENSMATNSTSSSTSNKQTSKKSKAQSTEMHSKTTIVKSKSSNLISSMMVEL